MVNIDDIVVVLSLFAHHIRYRDDLTNFLINNFNMESEDIAEYIKRMENDRKCA